MSNPSVEGAPVSDLSPTTGGVAAIVVTYNSEQHLDALLDSLPEAFGDVPYTTVVVDNGSTDGTLALARARTECVVVASSNKGYGAGLNEGVRQGGSAEFVLALNPDATLEPGAISGLIAQTTRTGVGIVTPLVVEADGQLSLSLRREPTLARVGGLSFTRRPRFSEIVYEQSAYEQAHPVDWAMGAVMLVKRECWDELRGFDESFFLYSEETDFCLRARDRGWLTFFTPRAQVMHIGGGSGESATTHTMKMVNRVRIFRRRHGVVRSWIYYLLMLVTEARRGLLGHRASWAALDALLRPSKRPEQLRCGDRLLPL